VQEMTLVIVKPEGYEEGLTGAVLARFEKAGLKLEAIRVSRNERQILERHYPTDVTWLETAGGKSIDAYKKAGLSPLEYLGTEDAVEVGRRIHGWLFDYLLSGPSVPMVLSGENAIKMVRTLVGVTIPADADKGTIRGDFSSDSAIAANRELRAVRNIVHASGDPEEARREIELWFPGFLAEAAVAGGAAGA
jgi:nucleoside-diphosphate kinase